MFKKIILTILIIILVSLLLNCTSTNKIQQNIEDKRGYRDYSIFPREGIVIFPFKNKYKYVFLPPGYLNDKYNYISLEDYGQLIMDSDNFERTYIIDFKTATEMPPTSIVIVVNNDIIVIKKAFFENSDNWMTLKSFRKKFENQTDPKI